MDFRANLKNVSKADKTMDLLEKAGKVIFSFPSLPLQRFSGSSAKPPELLTALRELCAFTNKREGLEKAHLRF